MAKKKTYTPKTKQQQSKEPVLAYGEKRIVFFNSFEEENAHAYKERALTTPLENLKTVTIMLKLHFQKQLKENPTLGNRIYVDKQ